MHGAYDMRGMKPISLAQCERAVPPPIHRIVRAPETAYSHHPLTFASLLYSLELLKTPKFCVFHADRCAEMREHAWRIFRGSCNR